MTGTFKQGKKSNELCESSWLQRDSRDSEMVVPVKDGWEVLDFDNGDQDLKNLFKQYHNLRHSRPKPDVSNSNIEEGELHTSALEEFEQVTVVK